MICDTSVSVLQRREGLLQHDEDSLLFIHHRKPSSLRTSALEGCHICQPFWSQLSLAERDALLEFKLPEGEVRDENPEGWTDDAHHLKEHVTLCMLQNRELLKMPGSYSFACTSMETSIYLTLARKILTPLECTYYNHQLVCMILLPGPVSRMFEDLCS
jgi:hypothetical protein